MPPAELKSREVLALDLRAARERQAQAELRCKRAQQKEADALSRVVHLESRLRRAERVLKLNREFMRGLHKQLAARKEAYDTATGAMSISLEGNLKAVDALLLEPDFAAKGLAMARKKT